MGFRATEHDCFIIQSFIHLSFVRFHISLHRIPPPSSIRQSHPFRIADPLATLPSHPLPSQLNPSHAHLQTSRTVNDIIGRHSSRFDAVKLAGGRTQRMGGWERVGGRAESEGSGAGSGSVRGGDEALAGRRGSMGGRERGRGAHGRSVRPASI